MDQETYHRALMTKELEVQGIEQILLEVLQLELQGIEIQVEETEIQALLGIEMQVGQGIESRETQEIKTNHNLENFSVMDVMYHVMDVQILVTVLVFR